MKKNHLFAGVLGVLVIALVATFVSQSNSSTFKGSFVALRPMAYSLNSSNVTFLHTLSGTSSRSEITVTNNTNHSIQFSWSRYPSSVIRLENPNSFTVSANSSRQIGFVFAPIENVNRMYNATAVLFGDGIGREITLEGNGQESFHLSTTNVSFLPTVVGATSHQDVQIENYTGHARDFYVDNPRSTMYQVVTPHIITVAPHARQSVRFSFTPRVVRNFGEEVEQRIIYPIDLQHDGADHVIGGVDLTFSSRSLAR